MSLMLAYRDPDADGDATVPLKWSVKISVRTFSSAEPLGRYL